MKRNLLFASVFVRLLAVALLLTLGSPATWAQTTAFSYQGQLTDGSAPANGPYDLQFKLFDAVTNGNQVGATVTRDDLNVTNGVFNTSLDFGAAAFPGAARWLEISVRAGASTGAYTTLTPRQQINSTPYAIRALSAETVTGSVPASQLTGTLPPGVLPPGGLYIENTTTQQASSNFNISGDGTAGGTLSGNVVNTATQYNLNGQRLLGAPGGGNLVGGRGAGNALTADAETTIFGFFAGALTTGSGNSFFGNRAGNVNTTGTRNAFFGRYAGYLNTTGSRNAFFGDYAGANNVNTGDNSYFGTEAGYAAHGGVNNSFFGSGAGYNARSSNNAFFGYQAGYNTQSGGGNVFVGQSAGAANVNGSFHTFVGTGAGFLSNGNIGNTFLGYTGAHQHTTGDFNTYVGYATGNQSNGTRTTLLGANASLANANLTYATAIGADAVVGTNNTIVLGRAAGQDRTLVAGPLDLNSVPGGGSVQLCVLANRVSTCSSSQRYKANVVPLSSGLNVVARLRPVSFDWKGRDERDLGFIAEEVAEIEPLLTFRNDKGEIEGVKYAQISVVLINAVKEQQAQIEQLKKIVCADHPSAAVCQSKQQ
jgi:hypothetical protein